MRFNLGVTGVCAVVSVSMIGQLVAAAEGERGTRFALLACIAAAAAVTVWRALNRQQEPAVFAAATYLAFGAVVAIADAFAGDYTRAVIIAITVPILPGVVVGDPRTRRWVNTVGGYTEANTRAD